MGTNFPTGLQVRKSSGDIRASKTVIRTVLYSYLYISCDPQGHCLLSEHKTLLFIWSFSKHTSISHSIIIIALPSAFQSRCVERTRHRRHSLAKERLILPCQQRTIIPLIQPSPLLKDNKKECFRGVLETIWISNRTREEALKEKPLCKWRTVPTNLSFSLYALHIPYDYLLPFHTDKGHTGKGSAEQNICYNNPELPVLFNTALNQYWCVHLLRDGVWTLVSGEKGCSNEIIRPRPCLG